MGVGVGVGVGVGDGEGGASLQAFSSKQFKQLHGVSAEP